MSASIEMETLDFVDAAGKALAEAEKLAGTVEQTETKLASLAPTLADKLVGLGLIDSTLKGTAIERMQDPVKVAETLVNVLTHYEKKANTKQAEATGLGAAVAPAATPVGDGVTGRRRPPSEKTAADEPLRRLAGLS